MFFVVIVSGADGFTSEADQDEVQKIEGQLKNRFPICSHMSKQRIIQDFLKQVSVITSSSTLDTVTMSAM